MSRLIGALSAVKWVVPFGIACTAFAQQPAGNAAPSQPAAVVQFLAPTPPVPLFFREPWKQVGALDASTGFRPQHPITQQAVTNASLQLTVHDPGAKEIAGYATNPPPGSNARDWRGPACIQMSGYQQAPTPDKVVAGEPTDPPNAWTGVCLTPVAATLRDRNNYVDLTGLAKIRWVTRVSGFHVVRPVIRLANGTWLVGDYAEGGASANSTVFLETEFAIAPIRWLALDISRVITRGTWVDKPDLSRVDEVGFADLLPGSGHGWGGFINVGRIEVYGKPVRR